MLVAAEIDQNIRLNTIEEAIQDIKDGKILIVVDDEDRENEGDFFCAEEKISPELINFMAKFGRGLICTPIFEQRARELDLDLMVKSNTAMHNTAFTVSIDLIGQGCTTGISAYDRSTGIKAIINPETKAEDFARPGHIFPLIAKSGGVLRRTGHTEAAVDLARLAGCYPAGVLVEILNEDGSMARLPQLLDISKQLGIKIISITRLVAYRMRTERLVTKELETMIVSPFGELKLRAFAMSFGAKAKKAARGPIAKNIGAVRARAIREQLGLKVGDAAFFVAGDPAVFYKFAGLARNKVADELNLSDKDHFKFCWIVDFPMYEWSEEEKKIDFSHNPFSMPNFDHEAFLKLDVNDRATIEKITAFQYDIMSAMVLSFRLAPFETTSLRS